MSKGKQSTAEELAKDVQKFIDGSASVLDSDEIYTFSLADPALEKIRNEVIDVLDRMRWTEANRWCDESGVADLERIRSSLLR